MMFKSVFASRLSIFRPSIFTPAMALAAALALGSLPAATDAVAQFGERDGGGFRARAFPGPGFRRGGYREPLFRGGRYGPPPGFAARRGPAFRGGYPPDGEARPFARRIFRDGAWQYDYYGCYSWRWSATPWGWQWRRVNVCYPSY